MGGWPKHANVGFTPKEQCKIKHRRIRHSCNAGRDFVVQCHQDKFWKPKFDAILCGTNSTLLLPQNTVKRGASISRTAFHHQGLDILLK